MRLPAPPAVAVTFAGTLAPVESFVLPNAAGKRIALPSGDGKEDQRRLLAGHAATGRLLLVHRGQSVIAYDTEGPGARGRVWATGDTAEVGEYLHELLDVECLPREGIATTASACFATLDQGGSALPRLRLGAFRIGDGKTLWSKTGDSAGISHAGTPLPAGDKVFCGAVSLEAPNETWVVARSVRDGALLWKRALAASSGTRPLLVPTPTLALVQGELVAISQNGVVASLAPGTGDVLWAIRYTRSPGFEGDSVPVHALDHAPAPALPVPCGGVVLAPQDGSVRLVRALDGSPLGRMARGSSEDLVGFAGGRVVFAGDETASFLEIQSIAVGLNVRVLVDGWPFVARSEPGRSGRAALVGDALLLPGEKGLDAVRIPDGATTRLLEWDEPGDLVVGGSRIFSVGARGARLLGSTD